MAKNGDDGGGGTTKPEEFRRFEELAKRLVTVPKRELDKKRSDSKNGKR